jgi:hypothetical protein
VWLWIWLAVIVGAGLIVLAAFAGGPWLLIIVAVTLVWLFFGVRFLISERGKAIAFGRFDERYVPRDRR